MKTPSPAAGIAFLAPLVARSGTAVALPGTNRVEGSDIKKNAITGAKVKNDSLKGLLTGCTAGGNPLLSVSFSGSDYETMEVVNDGAGVAETDAPGGTSVGVLTGPDTAAIFHLSVGTANGKTFDLSGLARDSAYGDESRCSFHGVLAGG